MFFIDYISLPPVKFDVDIVELAAATGTDRIQLVAQLQECLAEQTILKASVLSDRNGTVFGWVFPGLLTSEEHVSQPLSFNNYWLLTEMASQYWWVPLWKRKMHCESVRMHRGEQHHIGL